MLSDIHRSGWGRDIISWRRPPRNFERRKNPAHSNQMGLLKQMNGIYRKTTGDTNELDERCYDRSRGTEHNIGCSPLSPTPKDDQGHRAAVQPKFIYSIFRKEMVALSFRVSMAQNNKQNNLTQTNLPNQNQRKQRLQVSNLTPYKINRRKGGKPKELLTPTTTWTAKLTSQQTFTEHKYNTIQQSLVQLGVGSREERECLKRRPFIAAPPVHSPIGSQHLGKHQWW